MSQREEIERLYRKYDLLLDYSNQRQKQYIEHAKTAREDYENTGDHTSRRIAENNEQMSSRISTESIIYKNFRDELKEVLEKECTKKADALASAGKKIN